MRHFNLFILLTLMSTQAFGTELLISVNTKNELELTAKTCEELLVEQSSMCEWKKKIDPNFIIPNTNKCTALRNGQFKITISECLPTLAKSFQNKKLYHEGPNCWGTAMSFKALSPVPRFMWPEEMTYWMESPVCRKLNPGEVKLPGDIINIYGPEKLDESEKTAQDAGTKFWDYMFSNRSTPVTEDFGIGFTGFHRLLHSVTYVSARLAFGKDSPSQLDAFYFHPMEEVYGRPRSDEVDCQENQVLSPHIREYQNTPKRIHGRKCSYMSLAYRCENFKNYFSKQNLQDQDLALWNRIIELQSIQKKLFPIVTTLNTIISKSELIRIKDLSETIILQTSREMQDHEISDIRKQLLTLQYFTASGIKQSLLQAGFLKKK